MSGWRWGVGTGCSAVLALVTRRSAAGGSGSRQEAGRCGSRGFSARPVIPPEASSLVVPAAQTLARVAVAHGAVPVAASALSATARLMMQYVGVGTFATGAGLMVESRRRSQLPEVCSSHGRSTMMEASPGVKAAQLTLATAQRATRLTIRAVYLGAIFTPALLLGLLVYATSNQRLTSLWYELLRVTLERGGSAFIKWGQWASTRSDIFPVELCGELSHLHQGAPVHSLAYTRSVIREELGQPLEEIFDTFAQEPVASGSVAQVYKASYGGKPVAVKVRHPNVAEQIRDDFVILGALVSLVANLKSLEWLNLEASLQQFSHTMADQVMLDAEARHLTRFIHLFWGRQGVSFPVPQYPLVTPAVLVESFEFASSVTSGINSDLDDTVRKYIVHQGTQIYLQMLLADNFMHADLHPGNILLRDDEKGMPQLVLVDAGMVAQLVPEEQENFIGLFQAIGAGDGLQAAQHILNFTTQQTCGNVAAFNTDMQTLFSRCCRGYHTNVDIGEVVRGCLEVVREHKVRVDANYATLMVNVLCIESLGRQMMPDYNILDSAKPMLESHRVLGTKALAVLMPLYSLYSAAVDRVMWWQYSLMRNLSASV